MNKLSEKQLNQIGARFVFDKITPVTAFGQEMARAVAPYKKCDEAALFEELDNVETAAGIGTAFDAVLSKFRDIRGSVKKLTGGVLSLVELFEMKAFLLTLDDLADMPCVLNKTYKIGEALALLDPDGTRLRSFFISERYSDKLRGIRARKLAADNEEERLRVVSEEEDEELNVRIRLTALLSAFAADFNENIKHIAWLDFVLAKGKIAREFRCVKPRKAQKRAFFKNMYSPEVADALAARELCVTPTDIEISPGVSVLTGANMGGKSVALKTLALNVYLFQCGMLVFADEAELSMFEYIDFIFDDESSIYSGLSSFGAEITHINEMVKQAEQKFCLLILDEPAKGTNPREGRAIAAGLARYLNGLDSVSVLSTHYDNVAGDEYKCYVTVDYRLVEASTFVENKVPNDALNICRRLGLKGELLELIEGELVLKD